MLTFQRFIIEEAFDGDISHQGLVATTTRSDRGWCRSNLMYAFNGLKLQFKACKVESFFSFGISEKDCFCGLKEGNPILITNIKLNCYYYGSLQVRSLLNGSYLFGFSPFDYYVDGRKKSEEEKRTDKSKIPKELIEVIKSNNNGNKQLYQYDAPPFKPYEINEFELNFSLDESDNAYVNITINGIYF